MRNLLMLLGMVCLMANPSSAAPKNTEARAKIGYGRITTNDIIGDGHDRWRTGSVASSRVWGYGWNGQLPSRPGDILELRFLGQIIAPDRIDRFRPADRPYAGALSIGLHTHFQKSSVEWAFGADLVAIGPQTGLDDFQDMIHGAIGAPRLFSGMQANQIPDTFRPTLVAEAGRDFVLPNGLSLRPFAEARAGDESLFRIGADLVIGGQLQDTLLVRDPVSGQRYKAVRPDDRLGGATIVLGADIAHVANSVYLPEDRGYTLTDTRQRVRAGLHWDSLNAGYFYGLTWLGREFTGQKENQFVGTLKIDLRF